MERRRPAGWLGGVPPPVPLVIHFRRQHVNSILPKLATLNTQDSGRFSTQHCAHPRGTHSLVCCIPLQRLLFAIDAQKWLHGGCGRLWKSVENVTAKTLAEALARTYVEARQARTLYRRCQRAKAAEKGAIGSRSNRIRTNARSQMSTYGGGVEVGRLPTETTGSVRTLGRGCQRTEAGRGDATDHRDRQIRRERSIADINMPELVTMAR